MSRPVAGRIECGRPTSAADHLVRHRLIPRTRVRLYGDHVVKQTFKPSRFKRARTHGFRARNATRNGRKVLQARRAKGRARLAP